MRTCKQVTKGWWLAISYIAPKFELVLCACWCHLADAIGHPDVPGLYRHYAAYRCMQECVFLALVDIAAHLSDQIANKKQFWGRE